MNVSSTRVRTVVQSILAFDGQDANELGCVPIAVVSVFRGGACPLRPRYGQLQPAGKHRAVLRADGSLRVAVGGCRQRDGDVG